MQIKLGAEQKSSSRVHLNGATPDVEQMVEDPRLKNTSSRTRQQPGNQCLPRNHEVRWHRPLDAELGLFERVVNEVSSPPLPSGVVLNERTGLHRQATRRRCVRKKRTNLQHRESESGN